MDTLQTPISLDTLLTYIKLAHGVLDCDAARGILSALRSRQVLVLLAPEVNSNCKSYGSKYSPEDRSNFRPNAQPVLRDRARRYYRRRRL